MGFSRQEDWHGLPCPPLGDLPNPGIQPRSPTLQSDSLPPDPPGKPNRRNQRDRELEGDRETEKKMGTEMKKQREKERKGRELL